MRRFRIFWNHRKIFINKKVRLKFLDFSCPVKERFHSLATWREVDFPSSQKVHSTSLGAIFDSWSIGDIYFSLRQLLPCQIKHFLPKSGSENLVSSPNNSCSCWGVLKWPRSDFECTTGCFMILMDQKKCFRVFFWPPPGKILKYWIRNPCYNTKILKLEISISDPKITQTHISDLEFHTRTGPAGRVRPHELVLEII